MRVLLIGATGFLGSAIHAALRARSDSIIATYHRGAAPVTFAGDTTDWRQCDMARQSGEEWQALLTGVDAIINCAGILQDNAWDSTSGVHVTGLRILVDACERTRIFRFIHFSAIGVDRRAASLFSRSKGEAERIIQQSLLDWVILRPTVVVGANAFGGSALFRGLAALPVLPVMPDTGPLQIVQRDDVVATVLHFLKPESRPRQALDLAGPETYSMAEVVAIYRRWLGWPAAEMVFLPRWSANLLYRLGDFARMLGWRPPLGSTARREMRYGATGNCAPWQAETGIRPAGLQEALWRTPAGVQERWFAVLYALKPVGFTVFSLFWILTGIVSLTFGFNAGIALVKEGGFAKLAFPLVAAGALADIVIGCAIALRPSAKWGLIAALVFTGLYLVAGTALLPRLWAQPLGPLVKVLPLLVFNLMLLAITEER